MKTQPKLTKPQQSALSATIIAHAGQPMSIDDFYKLIWSAANNTWNTIGGDYLQLGEGQDISGKEVSEVVPDYMDMYAGGDKDMQAAMKVWGALWKVTDGPKIRQVIMRACFPLKWYGY
jgi:hypothetical protein